MPTRLFKYLRKENTDVDSKENKLKNKLFMKDKTPKYIYFFTYVIFVIFLRTIDTL